jgi:hypothetical protein
MSWFHSWSIGPPDETGLSPIYQGTATGSIVGGLPDGEVVVMAGPSLNGDEVADRLEAMLPWIRSGEPRLQVVSEPPPEDAA